MNQIMKTNNKLKLFKARAKNFVAKWYERQYGKEMLACYNILVYEEVDAVSALLFDRMNEHIYIYTEKSGRPSVSVYHFVRCAYNIALQKEKEK